MIVCKEVRNVLIGLELGEIGCGLKDGICKSSFIKNFRRFLLIRNV